MAPRRTALFGQAWTLATKNLTIIFTSQIRSTVYTAFVLPILVSVYLGVFLHLNQPSSKFGIGESRPVRSLQDGLAAASSSRDIVAFVDNGLTGGSIDKVIDSLSDAVKDAGKNATRLSTEEELGTVCLSSVRGATSCYGAVVFNSSPDEGHGGIWNYTLRADSALGRDIKTSKDNNDAQVYTLPLQRAVDSAIANLNSTGSALPHATNEYPFTAETEDERQAKLRQDFQSTFIHYLGVAVIVALIGISYHMPGMIGTERETGMSQLVDSMMLTKFNWEPQVARLLSYFWSFVMVYLPGWIIAAVLARVLIWKHTNAGIIIVHFLLSGLALTSFALLGATFFKKAQLSGVVNSVIFMVLGIVAQALSGSNTGAVAVLGVLFAPCSITFFIIYIARFEKQDKGANLAHAAPDSPWNLPGVVFWVFLIIQIIVYPIIAAFLERLFHGVASDRRKLYQGGSSGKEIPDAVRIEGMTKIYQPSLLRRIFSFVSRPRPPTVAVDNLTLSVKKGQIFALLGANGSGKSTTLDAIAGISRFTSGSISIDTSGGLGIAPQQNVLWDDLTVQANISFFNRLKSPHSPASITEIRTLIEAIGLETKIKAKVKTLSGGQKRKLQLGLMLTGGSSVCCVDEVSSGIDPLSRRKIWDILLSERGRRTLILTTHFLDEADLLSDHIAILSKGSVRAQGSAVELKDTLGAGYRIYVLEARDVKDPPEIDGVERKVSPNTIEYTAESSSLAAATIRALEAQDIRYRLSGPTIEDVFLQVAEEVRDQTNLRRDSQIVAPPGGASDSTEKIRHAQDSEPGALQLLSGRPVGFLGQTWVLIRKRFTVMKSNWLPYLVAFLIPIVAAAVTQILIRGEKASSCAAVDSSINSAVSDYAKLYNDIFIVAGPSSDFNESSVSALSGILLPNSSASDSHHSLGASNIQLVTSLSSFNDDVDQDRKNVTPAGMWLGSSNSPPTLAYKADDNAVYTAAIGQNLMDVLLSNVSIAMAYKPFDSPFSSATGDALQTVIYFSIACAVFPAFFALYPNVERRMNVRGLQYSSGVRSLPLWTSHLAVDFSIILISVAIATIIYATASDIWYHVAYLFPVFMLYGLASLLLGYVLSLIFGSQLSTYAGATVVEVVGEAVYVIAYLFILSFSSTTSIDRNINIAHFVISIFVPIGSLIRSMLIAVNAFSAACDGQKLQSNPATMTAYGGPILYLIIQALILFGILLWHDSGAGLSIFGRRRAVDLPSNTAATDEEVANEELRVTAQGPNSDGLQVKHVTKSFGSFTALDNVTFGVDHSEIFALLGPNGAGKSTMISLIRGDLQVSQNGGDVFVENVSVGQQRAVARRNMGVCPQFDAIDSMTVTEHLRHYARLRGISDVNRQVEAVIQAVGLEAYKNTMAPHLSGGNKRKLSLGIALTGNPSVILLDEPSSGLDAAAKRIMWRTLETLVPGRSILLTTHSMEEADALATRAGILAQRMLAVGTTERLRERFGDTLHVHIVTKTAPRSTPEEMDRLRDWVVETFPGAEVETETYHGQIRFSIPAAPVLERAGGSGSALGHLVVMLEENKEALGIAHHSVSPTTLNQVFLTIVGQHDVQEEGYTRNTMKGKSIWQKLAWAVKMDF